MFSPSPFHTNSALSREQNDRTQSPFTPLQAMPMGGERQRGQHTGGKATGGAYEQGSRSGRSGLLKESGGIAGQLRSGRGGQMGSISPSTPNQGGDGSISRSRLGQRLGNSMPSPSPRTQRDVDLFKGSPLSLDDLKTMVENASKHQTRSVYGGLNMNNAYAIGGSMIRGKMEASTSGSAQRPSSGGLTGIAKACAAVETWLKQNSEDHRAFFDNVFRVLLQEVFGLGKPKDKSWLYIASKQSLSSSSGGGHSDARHLRNLLDPQGVLMTAVLDADERNLYPHGFTFPIETLPAVAGVARTQSLLRQGRETLMAAFPHYRGRLISAASASLGGQKGAGSGFGLGSGGGGGSGKTEVRLSLWEYFVSWLVFYAIQEPGGASDPGSSSSKYSLRPKSPMGINDLSNMSWNTFTGTAKELFSGSGSPKQTRSSTPVYKDLLEAYIKTYVQFQPLVQQLGLSSPMALTPSSASKASLASRTRHSAAKRQFMLDVMMEFWLSDVNQVDSGKSMRTISFVCPSSNLIGSIKQLVKHLVQCTNAVKGGTKPVTTTGGLGGISSMRSPTSPVMRTASQENLKQETYVALWTTKRALYRFLLRCFALWPTERSASLKPVIDLWVTYLAPWEGTRRRRSTKKEQPMSLIRRTVSMTTSKTKHKTPQDTSAAKAHAEDLSEWKDHILSNMPFYTTLMQYFVNLQYARATSRPESAITDMLIVLDTYSGTERLASFLRETEQDLHMHASGSLIGSKYFERFSLIRHDYHELHKYALQGLPATYVLGDISYSVLRTKESIVSVQQQQIIDVLSISRKLSSSKLEEVTKLSTKVFDFDFKLVKPGKQRRTPQEKKSVQMYRSFTWHDVVAFQKRYKGDWMKRPVSSYEIPVLMRFWVRVSERANTVLGLDQHEGAAWLHASDNFALRVLAALLAMAKQKNLRVNLRFLSSKWISLMLALYACVLLILPALWPWATLVLTLALITQM